MTLGLSEHEARELMSELEENGGLLKFLGCEPGVRELINSLHTNSWFKYSDLETIIVSNRGGRQGCKMGGHVFVLIYSKDLLSLHKRLRGHGIVLRISKDDVNPFWTSSSSRVGADAPGDDIVEATFVDDECLMLCASSPKKLDAAAATMFVELISIFTNLAS